jgi:hypothetical protein
MYAKSTFQWIRKVSKEIEFLGLLPIKIHPNFDRTVTTAKLRRKFYRALVFDAFIQSFLLVALSWVLTNPNVHPLLRLYIVFGTTLYLTMIALGWVFYNHSDEVSACANLVIEMIDYVGRKIFAQRYIIILSIFF